MKKIGIIGGGVIGVCTAIESLKLGHSVTLFESSKCFSETSSKSSKLLHGGIRYLENFEFGLVFNALKERRKWYDDFRSDVQIIKKYIPIYSDQSRSSFYIYLGAKLYQFLSLTNSLGPSGFISKKSLKNVFTDLNHSNLKCGIFYHDLLMDDQAISKKLLKECKDLGAHVNENTNVIGITKDGKIKTANSTYKFDNIINCAGPWADHLESDFNFPEKIRLIKGSHIIVKKKIQNSLLMQNKSDNRVTFLLPLKNKALIGTTEVGVKDPSNTNATTGEITYLLNTYNQYFSKKLTNKDIVDTYSGVRVVLDSEKNNNLSSREHKIYTNNRAITVIGGKWTSARTIAKETVKKL